MRRILLADDHGLYRKGLQAGCFPRFPTRRWWRSSRSRPLSLALNARPSPGGCGAPIVPIRCGGPSATRTRRAASGLQAPLRPTPPTQPSPAASVRVRPAGEARSRGAGADRGALSRKDNGRRQAPAALAACGRRHRRTGRHAQGADHKAQSRPGSGAALERIENLGQPQVASIQTSLPASGSSCAPTSPKARCHSAKPSARRAH